MNNNELWENIKGYEGKYQISNTGKIKTLNYNNTGKEKELKPKINKNGYLEIKLSIHNITKDFQVSRLVIKHFTDIELNKNIIILYKDDNKLNCNINNLYLTTRGKYQEYIYDCGKRKRIYVDFYGNKLNIKQLSKLININEKCIRNRLRSGWSNYELDIPKGV